jgi:dephospho-CoA kinase
VVEAALMVEVGTWRLYDRLVVVHAPLEDRVARMAVRGLDPEQTRARIQAQMPLEEKISLADYPVDNGGGLEALREHISSLYSMLCEDLEAKLAGKALPRR